MKIADFVIMKLTIPIAIGIGNFIMTLKN